MILIGCKYNESKNALSTYESFYVCDASSEEKHFATENPVQDFQNAMQYAREISQGITCSLLSSVNDFIADCDGYFSWYKTVNGYSLFDENDKAVQYDAEHKIEFWRRANSILSLLLKLNIDENKAKSDTLEMMNHCSEETILALDTHAQNYEIKP